MFQYFLFLLFTVVLYTALNSYKSQTCNKRNISSAPEANLYPFRPVVTRVKKENKTAVSSPVTGKNNKNTAFTQFSGHHRFESTREE